jgi:hypothetical protein
MLYECLVIVNAQYESKQVEATSVEDAIVKLEEQYGKDNIHFVPYEKGLDS